MVAALIHGRVCMKPRRGLLTNSGAPGEHKPYRAVCDVGTVRVGNEISRRILSVVHPLYSQRGVNWLVVGVSARETGG